MNTATHMKKGIHFTPIRKAAILAGSALIAMALTAAFSFGFSRNSILVEGDAAATLLNFNNSRGLFIAGLIGWVFIAFADLQVAWALNRFYKPVNAKVSLATGLVRMVYTVILGMAIYQLAMVLPEYNSAALGTGQEILDGFANFDRIWSQGLIIFGVHLLGLGWLLLRQGKAPKVMGWLLYVGGIGYVLIAGMDVFFPAQSELAANIEMFMSIPMTLAELSLAFWLLIKGGRS